VQNCVFRGFSNLGSGISLGTSSANVVAKIWHSTFHGCEFGVSLYARADIRNCLFTNNLSFDANVNAPAVASDLNYNGFETDTGPFGNGNAFGIVSGNNYVNEATNDFHLKATAPLRNIGDATVPVAADKDGVLRPQEGGKDLGAYEYLPPATPTPTATPTTVILGFTETASPTETGTASPSETETASPSETETASPSETETASPTETETASPSETATASPTATETASPSETETATASPTHTETATTTASATVTPTFSHSPSITPTPTLTPDLGCSIWMDQTSSVTSGLSSFSFAHTNTLTSGAT
jgi:hypothetical protein